MALWLNRAGSAGEYENKFLDDNRIYLTWDDLDLDLLQSVQERDDLYEHVERIYPDGKPAKYRNWISQIWAFVFKMERGDWVALPSKQKSSIHIGEIQSDYTYDPSQGSPYFHYRAVDWFAEDIPRSNFDQDILYSMGAFLTVCQIKRNDAEARIREMADNDWKSLERPGFDIDEDSEESVESIDLELMANDEIARYLQRKFKGHRMTRIIEALLQAKGYITYRSPEGPDKGVDILAAPEPLGFGSPSLCVQVKTGATPVDRPTLDQLLGTMQNFNAEQGLLVSWSGFKSSVDKEVPAQFFRVRLWDQKTIIQELLENYSQLEEEIRATSDISRGGLVMETQVVLTREDQSFTLETALLPELEANDIAVRTVYSGVSIGTEFALIRGKISWGPYPLVTGYQATGIVERVGDEVRHLKVGDRVFVRGNKSITLNDGTKVSSVSGAHASHIVCDASPDSLRGPGIVPDGVDMGTAALYVMPAVALHGIDMAQPTALETVAVYGTGQIGIGVVALAALRGCRVIAIDINEKALKLADVMGAEHVINAGDDDWREKFEELVPGGADTVFEATGIPSCVDTALSLVRRTPPHVLEGQGKFVYQGNYGKAPLTYNFMAAHGRNLRCFYPCDDGLLPNRRRIMHLLAIGALKWKRVITHRLPYTDAPPTFEAINKGDDELIGVIFNWSEV